MAVHDSTRPVAIDKTGISFSFGAAKWTVIAFVTAIVAVLSIFPFLLSGEVKVATEGYVNREVGSVKSEIQAIHKKMEENSATTSRIEENLRKQRASQEAERVTASIMSADERIKVYQRVYEANIRRLARNLEPVGPNEIGGYR